jgi:hypothetical protein
MRETIKELKAGSEVGIMVPEEELPHFTDKDVAALGLGSFTAMEMTASKLLETMRALGKKVVHCIITLALANEGIGLGVFDRLFEAAGSQMIEVD